VHNWWIKIFGRQQIMCLPLNFIFAQALSISFSKLINNILKSLEMAFEFTDSNFKTEALDKKGVTVVDFGAEWCGPCRMIGPIIETLATEYTGKANIGKIDVDNNPETSMKFGVRNIPTIVFLKDGVMVDKIVGAPTAQALKAKIDGLIAVPA
jgi:thioredoxin 1